MATKKKTPPVFHPPGTPFPADHPFYNGVYIVPAPIFSNPSKKKAAEPSAPPSDATATPASDKQ